MQFRVMKCHQYDLRTILLGSQIPRDAGENEGQTDPSESQTVNNTYHDRLRTPMSRINEFLSQLPRKF